MPAPYLEPHWSTFSKTTHKRAGKIGFAPADWARAHGLTNFRDCKPLPHQQLDREAALDICENPDNSLLYSFVCAMAWGSLGARGGPPRVQSIMEQWDKLEQHLTKLRAGRLNRAQAYNLFTGSGAIPGLGPSYFTKLLFFFGPGQDHYIMDQWTGKSVNLLTGWPIVRMTRSSEATPLPSNKAGNYQAYCEEVDHMASHLNLESGECLEEMLMSKGRPEPWPWRHHVRTHWPSHAPTRRYDATEMHRRYPHIPQSSF